jgi:phosphoglycolate phosphatase-like HAD superfamily hydrolase
MKFILFDIDGTLIDSGGAGLGALDLAFREMYSVDDAFRDIPMAGRTDLQIIREGLELHGIGYSEGAIPEFSKTYIKYLMQNVDNRKGHVKDGVREVLERLDSCGDYMLGLLTGNIEEGARIKLEHFGLHGYFRTGAFGSDSEDRNELLPIAVEKLRREFSLEIDFRDCFVIGDTPKDVDCAKCHGAYAIAVATGPYSCSALSEAGADLVLQDLSDTDRLLSVLQNGKGHVADSVPVSCKK